MHIKNIHCIIEKLAETTKVELDKGIENVDTKEMGEVADIIKDLAEAEYYAKISKAMDEAEYGEDYDYMGAYDEHSRKGYRGQPRDSKGRYMSRRGYESRMMPEMYDYSDMEHMRDMDRDYGKMYYADGMNGSSRSGSSSGMSNGNSRGYSESRYDRARRGYEESKAMHKGNTAEDKQHKMKELENYMKELSTDVTDMISDMSAEEKSLMKQKMPELQRAVRANREELQIFQQHKKTGR
jgi:hypothetical protein